MLSVLRRVAILTSIGMALATFGAHAQTPVAAPGAGSVVVLETAKGIIEFETYPDTAPKAVATSWRSCRDASMQDSVSIVLCRAS